MQRWFRTIVVRLHRPSVGNSKIVTRGKWHLLRRAGSQTERANNFHRSRHLSTHSFSVCSYKISGYEPPQPAPMLVGVRPGTWFESASRPSVGWIYMEMSSP
ncbi:hypothetical protein K456DRAFT_47761 [Colletotrichum gloeosporioides 23]|nr:hypothetical protein K456DRAFT_47761 [Colletotrichum gloeosporioides 23]